MKHELDTALDQCLIWLRGGMDMESCLARYPEYADELRPLLELVADIGRVIVPASSAAARAAGEQRMLATWAQKRKREAGYPPIFLYARRMMDSFAPTKPAAMKAIRNLAVVSLMIALIVAGGAAVTAAADSVPGDTLYPVKLTSQRVQLALTRNPARRRLLEEQFNTQRRLDAHAALKGGRQLTVEFQGVLQQMEGSLWMVGGVPVTLQDTTTIQGQPYLGARVRVQGDLPGDGVLLATRLSVEPTLEPGLIQTPEPSDTVQPTETPEPTRMSRPTDTPELTRTERPTETPEPTRTPAPPETLKPTETPEPSGTPGMPEAPDVTATPEPGETPDRDETLEPTEMPEPDETPEPDGTLEPDETSEPDETPDHDEGADPTELPEPDETPERDETPGPTEEPGD